MKHFAKEEEKKEFHEAGELDENSSEKNHVRELQAELQKSIDEKRTLEARLISLEENSVLERLISHEENSVLREKLGVMTTEKNALQVRLNAFGRNHPSQEELNHANIRVSQH